MNLFDRVGLWVRATLNDIFSEEKGPLGGAGDPRLSALLESGEAHLAALRQELTDATVREKRAELEWRAAQAQSAGLDLAIDDALRTGHDEAARTQLAQGQAQQQRAQGLGELYETSRHTASLLQQEVEALQRQLDETRRSYAELEERERSVAAREQLVQARRTAHREASALRAELAARQEHVARREDQAAAREEIDQERKT